jgi:transcriptional regulator with XRE-family HTH domain
MQSKEKIIELNKKLPHGARKKIADESGLSLNTVARYFRGEKVNFTTEVLIIKGAKAIVSDVEELEKEKQQLFK